MPTKPRKGDNYGSVKIHPRIHSSYVGYFVHLQKLGYGKNRTEVAEELIRLGVLDLVSKGILKEKHIRLKDPKGRPQKD